MISAVLEPLPHSHLLSEFLKRQHPFHVLLQLDQIILHEKIDPESLSRHIVLVDPLAPEKSSTNVIPPTGPYIGLQSTY